MVVIWASRILAPRTDMGTFFPLACMVSGEQLGEKQKLRKAAGTILLPQHGNNHRSWHGWKRGGGSDSPQSPAHPVDFGGFSEKRLMSGKTMRKFYQCYMGSEILSIIHVTYSKYKGAGWHREKPGAAQRTVTGNKELILKAWLKPKQDGQSAQKQQDSRSQRGLRFIP